MTLELEPHMAAKKKTIHLFYNDEITIVLENDGRTVSILLSYLEPKDQCPEVDIKFDKGYILNCFGASLSPAKVTAHGPNVLEGRQIIIPLEPEGC